MKSITDLKEEKKGKHNNKIVFLKVTAVWQLLINQINHQSIKAVSIEKAVVANYKYTVQFIFKCYMDDLYFILPVLYVNQSKPVTCAPLMSTLFNLKLRKNILK